MRHDFTHDNSHMAIKNKRVLYSKVKYTATINYSSVIFKAIFDWP